MFAGKGLVYTHTTGHLVLPLGADCGLRVDAPRCLKRREPAQPGFGCSLVRLLMPVKGGPVNNSEVRHSVLHLETRQMTEVRRDVTSVEQVIDKGRCVNFLASDYAPRQI